MSLYFNQNQKPPQKITPQKTSINVKSQTTNNCENTVVPLNPLTTGAVAKIPVVLAELEAQINVNAIITLPEDALEIKRIKKHLKITQCLLIQDTNVLFIKGFVRKNIEYATASKFYSSAEGVFGDIRHVTVETPFQCTTPVTFNGIEPLPVINRTSEEFEYYKEQKLGPQFAEKDKLLSGDLSEFNQISTEFFNELPYCELINSRIVEFDEFLNRKHPSKIKLPFDEKVFNSIEEKMVIFLTIKLLQNRQVAIPPVAHRPKYFSEEDNN